jgi:hypothetical protein
MLSDLGTTITSIILPGRRAGNACLPDPDVYPDDSLSAIGGKNETNIT